MSSLARYTRILRLFTVDRHAWTVQAMAEALAAPASSVYRAVSELVEAGMLEAAANAQYRLGPAFVEFDRLTRLTDPLVRHGSAVLQDTVAQARLPCVGLLSRLYGEAVLCVADAAAGGAAFRSSYERGRPMPLLRGATSKVILAHLPPRRLAALLQAEAARAQLGDTASAFRSALAEIRRRGFVVSRGEIDAGLVGLAAPVVAPPLGLVASLSLVVPADTLSEGAERSLVLMLVSAAAMLTDALARDS